jgi:hypothetical protein
MVEKPARHEWEPARLSALHNALIVPTIVNTDDWVAAVEAVVVIRGLRLASEAFSLGDVDSILARWGRRRRG